MAKKIGVVGCGNIGTEITLAVDSGQVKNAVMIALFDEVDKLAEVLQSKLQNSNAATFSDFSLFISSSSFKEVDIVIEAASQRAVRSFSKKIVESNKNLIIMSVGALVDRFFFSELIDIVSKTRGRIYIPTGAIAGIDAIRSAKHSLESVTLTTTKKPEALAGAPFFNETNIRVDSIRDRKVIYEGTAADAVKKFPANVNVAAVLSLAGIGIEKTKVKIIADPNIKVNQHEITAKGAFGEMTITTCNVPSPNNPKTSFLAVLSAIECLRSICYEGIRLGT